MKHDTGRHKLAGLEAGRGIAAVLVVTLHTWDHVNQAYGWFPLGALFAFGHAGVDFFFVLSGFIICHVHARDVGCPGRLGHYAERRFTRIYPFYWAMLGLALVGAAVSPHQVLPDAGAIASSALLLPVAAAPIIGVAWTLQNEMLFYTVFAVLILNRRAGRLALLVWFVSLLAATLAGPALPHMLKVGLCAKLTSYFNFHFFLGIGTAWLVRRRSVPRPLAVLLLSVAAFLATGAMEDAHFVAARGLGPHLGYALASTGMVLGLVELERRGRLVVPRMLTVLGGASYSIYLTHLLAIGAIWQILLVTGLARHLAGWSAFLLLLAGGTLAGVVIAAAIERPIIVVTRRLIMRRRPSPTAVLPPDQSVQPRLGQVPDLG